MFRATYFQGTFNLTCNEPTSRIDTSDVARQQLLSTYFYFLLKVLDLFDTVSKTKTFFILPMCRRLFCSLVKNDCIFLCFFSISRCFSFCERSLAMSHFCMYIIMLEWYLEDMLRQDSASQDMEQCLGS